MKLEKKLLLLFLFSLLCVSLLTIWSWPKLPLSDPLTYFDFADKRTFFSIPNAFDVLSNIPFFIVGLIGLRRILHSKKERSLTLNLIGFTLSFFTLLTAFGSGYFHLDPTPETLTWDRLPMTVVFMSLTTLIIADRVNEKMAFYSLLILIPIGIFTVWGYHLKWLSLRPYLIVQFGSILFILMLASFTRGNMLGNISIWSSVGLYGVAKVLEGKDKNLWDMTQFVSGHTLKHLFAAWAILNLLHFCQSKDQK